jgi:uncharacterized protein YbjT (DUF2867 family)
MQKVLIAGASGFIGQALIKKLLTDPTIEIVALSRSKRSSDHPRLVWKQCDLFSMFDISQAMEGCDQAYYLVHSMLPSAALSQGSFYDFDLILADNFSRCAKASSIQHLIYLGGMIPDSRPLSWHLKSRLEVEDALRMTGIKVTTLRAGLIIGKEGSSFEILRKLVARLPFMVCPAWTLTESQPIALEEILEVMVEVLNRKEVQGRIYDVGGPEVLTYQKLLLMTAKALGKQPRMVSFNLIPLKVSRFWVRWITGASRDLVYPLVLSLKYRMVADPSQSWTEWKNPRILLQDALLHAIPKKVSGNLFKKVSGNLLMPAASSPSPQKVIGYPFPAKEVRSIQRLVHPEGKTAEWVANEYMNWLPLEFVFLVNVHIEGLRCEFYFLTRKIPLLILEKSAERSTSDRQLLYIRGGLLADTEMKRGRLEFREALGGEVIISAIHEFRPALPWYIYRFTQAIAHLWVMYRFNLYLKKIDRLGV